MRDLAQSVSKSFLRGTINAQLRRDLTRDRCGSIAELCASCGQRDEDPPLVGRVATSAQEPEILEAFEQWGQRAGVKVQAATYRADVNRPGCLPEHKHRDVLRVGEAELAQQGTVRPGHRATCVVEGEAELAV